MAEALRESRRELTHATRGIEKEISALQSEEKKLVAEIKRTAKTGNEHFQTATKVLARQLIRLRQQIANLQGSRAQMRGIATHTQAISAQSSVAAGMKGATKAMNAMNKQMDPAKQAKVMQDFQRQSAQLDMTTEMMSDAIDDAIDDDEAEEETEDLTNQVLDEIGIDVASQLSAAPKGKISGKRTEESSSSGIDELGKRLAALRNP
ncbi:vacuolar protein sorting-associated protein 2 homolog 3-like isoform X2 [Solanum tuberosum]|uniref:vacuolar protein sorting-associated protein 2 homolog 3-like isoform X1 n=1 Tax=Solanum tuberosum TaxID=4113 RepID=UPI00073A155A|nr:PREDICTED: vacuolar protein sorting-associated protein 2 homolog 3-like isoform X1 [Solanum tuberosum]XP_015160951.1 PREDICTED: vacuolar protein sorting-associated protein 2 homolog 3-like isoform X2 [Solanum tuberosum]